MQVTFLCVRINTTTKTNNNATENKEENTMTTTVIYTNPNGIEMTETFKDFESARKFYNELIQYSYLGFNVKDVKTA